MSPTDSDRDTKSTTPKDKDDNPFVKFKRFADAQISSVLQGIIGLPSAFAKQSSDTTSHWADLQDELKRRDRILAEQRAVIGSELPRHNTDPEGEEVEIPVKKSPGWSLPLSMPADEPWDSAYGDKDGEKESIELFSPLTHSLFGRRYRRPNCGDVNGSQDELLAQIGPGFAPVVPGDLKRILSENQETVSALRMIQSKIVDGFHRSPSPLANGQLLGSQSILPYVLFSPYSPLNLSGMATPQDEFPYCKAFEDLLLVSQGRPMTNLALMSAYDRWLKTPPRPANPQEREFRRARAGLEWIDSLSDYGILTEKPWAGYIATRLLNQGLLGLFYTQLDPNGRRIVETKPEQDQDHETEQDIYNFLEHIGGSLPSPMPFRDAMQAMESFINDAVNYIAEQREQNEDGKTEPSQQASSRTASVDPHASEYRITRRFGSAGGNSKSTQTETLPDQTASAKATRSVETDQMEESPDGSAALPAADRVVATTTITEQTTNEDGSVHTSVMIHKVFADGSTSVTTTTKASFPCEDQHQAGEDGAGFPTEAQYPPSELKGGEIKKQQHDRKGWFWN